MTRYILFILLTISFGACEKRDVLGEQGELTGFDQPYLTLSSIPDSRPMDTITIASRFWAINDDIDRLQVFQEGYKVRDISMQWDWEVQRDTQSFLRSISYQKIEDSIFYPETLLHEIVNTGVALDTFYRTIDNAYVFIKPWVVPASYAIVDVEGEEAVMALSAEELEQVATTFVDQVDAWDVLYWYPMADSSYFELDTAGQFTGVLTSAGKDAFKAMVNTELLQENLTEAEYSEASEIKLKAKVVNKDNIEIEDESTFDILN